MSEEIKMARSRAAHMLDHVRTMLADRRSPGAIEEYLQRQYGIEPLTRCSGEAHSNPHIDHCGVCAPRWGWTGPRIKIT